MKLDSPKYIDESGIEHEIISLNEYKKRLGCPRMPNATLYYQIRKGNIDFVMYGKFKHIVYNEKAKAYHPRKNYGKRWKNHVKKVK